MPNRRYIISKNKDGYEYIECTKCHMKSYNSNDIKYKYCGNCHEFLDLPELEKDLEETNNISFIKKIFKRL